MCLTTDLHLSIEVCRKIREGIGDAYSDEHIYIHGNYDGEDTEELLFFQRV